MPLFDDCTGNGGGPSGGGGKQGKQTNEKNEKDGSKNKKQESANKDTAKEVRSDGRVRGDYDLAHQPGFCEAIEEVLLVKVNSCILDYKFLNSSLSIMRRTNRNDVAIS